MAQPYDNHWLIFTLSNKSLLVIELEEWAQVQWAWKDLAEGNQLWQWERDGEGGWMTESDGGRNRLVSIVKYSHIWHTVSFFFVLFLLQHLEHHSNHFCPVSCDEESQDTVSYDRAAFTCMARQWWNKGVANQSTCLKYFTERPSLSITLHSHISHNKLPPLADRRPGKCILQKLERLGARYRFWKKWATIQISAWK